jgi:outer membrane lipoprotein-sorting protein
MKKTVLRAMTFSNSSGFSRFPALLIVSVLALRLGVSTLEASIDDVLDQWFAAQKSLTSWSADFIQTRTLPTLTQPLITNGHVDFAMPGDFRWELGRPARTIALGHDSEMFVIYPLLKRAERYPLGRGAPKQWRDMMSLLQAGFPRNRQEFTAQFKVLSLTVTNSNWLLDLAPASAFARQMIPELRLGFATNNFQLTSTEMILLDGSRMRTDFTNATMNPPLNSNMFVWQPPADFKVSEPLKK